MTLYDLPLEMLDAILEKSYLHWILNSPKMQRDEEVIRSLISVDVCFNRRVTKRRFKKKIWRYMTEEEQQSLLNETLEQNETPSCITLCDLPLELLDIILQKSYLQWICNSSSNQRDEDVIRSLISVDVCFNRRITRQRFKKAIWRHLKYFFGKTKKRAAVIRNNRNYLLEYIQPNYGLLASLFSLNCLTEEQGHFIQRQRSKRDKNADLLYVVRSLDETKFANFVLCLRKTNQMTAARIMENGGGVMKIRIQTCGVKCTASMETQLGILHQEIEDLRNRSKPRSHQTDKLISQLKKQGIEILNSQLDGLTVVVWIWCHSQAAIENIQKLYESNRLRDVFFENIQPSTSKMINIDRNQFQKTVVVCPISINFTQRIDLGINESALGITKLRNEIYVLCRGSSLPGLIPHAIRVFEDLRCCQRDISFSERFQLGYASDIGSSEKEICLYVPDQTGQCVSKITIEPDDQHKIIKWLTLDYLPLTMSTSSDGRLLVVSHLWSILRIYGSEAELLRYIQLPRDIKEPIHAVETSIGNVIILHRCRVKEVEGERGSSWTERAMKWGISELSRDGKMVICRFIPSTETQELNDPSYLSLDSDDRVFVADTKNDRVILLDSDLKWNQILCPIKQEKGETRKQLPRRMYYDEKKKQLIVGGAGIYVYTMSQK